MNKITATISKIENVDNLNIVEFDFLGHLLKMMSLDLNKNIQVGQKVILVVKPTHIAIAKEFSGELSFSNQLNVTIHTIDQGKLLCNLTCKIHDTVLESIITASSTKRMHLQKGESITLLIKASDLSILEVCHD